MTLYKVNGKNIKTVKKENIIKIYFKFNLCIVLTYIDLSANNLTGPIPSQLPNLKLVLLNDLRIHIHSLPIGIQFSQWNWRKTT